MKIFQKSVINEIRSSKKKKKKLNNIHIQTLLSFNPLLTKSFKTWKAYRRPENTVHVISKVWQHLTYNFNKLKAKTSENITRKREIAMH